MRNLIFVDTETTGLEAEPGSLVELTYAGLNTEPKTLWFGVQAVPPFIDNLIGFTKRDLAGRRSNHFEVEAFLRDSESATMVAANPAFDKAHIDMAGLWRFHYRMLDIESFAMAKLNLDEVPSMKNIQEILTSKGFAITEPDHTSRNDVLALRDSYKALLRL